MKKMTVTEMKQVNGGFALAYYIVKYGSKLLYKGIVCLWKNNGLSNRSNCTCGLHMIYK